MKFRLFTKKKDEEPSVRDGTEKKTAAEAGGGAENAPKTYPHAAEYMKSEKDIPGVKKGFFARLGLDLDYLAGGLTQLFISLLAVGAVLYFGQYLYSTLSAGVSTAAVSPISETVTCEGTAFLIRDEKPLSFRDAGNFTFLAADGARVAKGEAVAGVYDHDIAAESRDLRAMQEEEALLARSLQVNGVLDALGDAASGYGQLMELSASGNWSGYAALADAFREKLNRSGSYYGTAAALAERIKELKAGEEALKTRIGTPLRTVTAPTQGYFFHRNDGYETLVSSEVVKGFNEETYEHLLSLTPENTDGRCGVLAANQKWYLAVSVEGKGPQNAVAGGTQRVIFPASDNRELEMTVQSVTRTENGMLLLLGADVLPRDFSWERIRTVKLVCEELSGYRIPASALHTEDGVTGVYVLQGKNVCFRRIEILHEGTGYCVAVPKEQSTPQPKTYRVISYPSVSAAEMLPRYADLAAARGISGKRSPWDGSLGAGTGHVNELLFLRGENRGIALSYLDTSPYYSYLDAMEPVIIAGRDLYHGKVVG